MSAEKKILVADDSPMVVAMLARTLTGAGYTVARAGNGIEAVQAAYSELPDLIVLDIFMPRMNGYQACRLLKSDPAFTGVPIIVLSGSESRSDEFWSLQTGADTFLSKSVDPPILLASVERLLAAAKKRQTEPVTQSLGPEDVLSKVSALMDRELYATTVQRNELNTILQNLSDGILTINMEGRIGAANRALCRMLDVEEATLAGQPYEAVLGEPAGPDTLALATEALSRGAAVPPVDSELAGRAGAATPVAISVAPLQDFFGKPVGCVCIFQDITRRKQIETLGKLKDDLTHMIVHDLRTPLTALIGGLQTIEILGELNDDQREFVQMSERGGTVLLEMINDLLDISKMEDGSMRLEYAVLQAEDLIGEAYQQVGQLVRDKGLNLITEVAPGLPPMMADEEKLRRTLVNLLGNAIKFTPPKGTITLAARLKAEENALLFSVRDTGEGIPREAFERIFEKFGQVGSRKAGRKLSTGLGLTFCKMVAEAHGGRIWVESELGQGSTFFFTVPLLHGRDQSPPERACPSS
jgi:PAS domain S-box-containing protein